MSFFSKFFKRKPKPMDWQQFTEYLSQQVAERTGCRAEIEWGGDLEDTYIYFDWPEEDDRAKLTAYFGNHFAKYRQNPDELDDIADALIASIEQSQDQEISADIIMPVVKSQDFVENVRNLYRENGDNPDDVVLRHLAGDIFVMYVFNYPDSLQSLSRSDAEELGLNSEAEIFDIAFENLENHILGLESFQLIGSENDSLKMIALDGLFDASLVLVLDKIIRNAELPFSDGTVFAVPARDLLLICDARDENAVARMQEIMQEEMSETAYGISGELFLLQNGQISLFASH